VGKKKEGPLGKQSAAILLGDANYYGTLAAVRSLGRAGVNVVTADPSMICCSRYSRYSSQHLRCPAFEETNAWAEWLVQKGRIGPRRAIYATGDAVSFALARYRDELSADFELYQPGLNTIMSILDKGLLMQNARAIGIETPPTWFPENSAEAAKIAKDMGEEVLIKPRSQLAQRTKGKGTVVESRGDRVPLLFDEYVEDQSTDSEFAKHCSTMTPLIQRYYPQAVDNVYSLSGFREGIGGGMIMRAARKILQRPRGVGIGLCFGPALVDPLLAEQAKRLCERIGYYGAFELEFVLAEGKAMLIDFNGRFYNQIGFDIARGIDSPALVYAAATGNQAEVARLMANGNAGHEDIAGFCNCFVLATMVRMQRILRTMSSKDTALWLSWSRGSHGTVIDAVKDPQDSHPAFVDVAQYLFRSLRHPRAFVRQYGLERAQAFVGDRGSGVMLSASKAVKSA
jgi:predicted ATP-grasp superfamily ATP-dependent carboligase